MFKNRKFNRSFWKTLPFWLGVFGLVGLIGDYILKDLSVITSWIMLFLILDFFLEGFTIKEK